MSNTIVVRLFPLLALAAAPSIAASQETISTDRPGLTFTPWLVSQGRFQAELGLPNLSLTSDDLGDTTAWNAPLQLRYGFSSVLELRLGSPTYTILEDHDAHTTTEGWGDVEVGAKVALSRDQGSMPKSALIGGVRLPVGEGDFTSRQAGYNLSLVADWSPGSGNSLRGQFGVTRVPTGSDDALQGSLVGLYGRALDDTKSAYVELGYLPDLHESVDQAFAGVGFAWLLSQDLQLDLSGDFGLNDDSPDAIVALGVSWRS